MRYMLVGIAAVVAMLSVQSANGQHLFLDTDDDGQCTSADALRAGGRTLVSVWVVTDRNLDGSPSGFNSPGNRPLTINSYEFILRAEDGSVEWGTLTNHQPTMTVPFGPKFNETDYYHGFGGMDALAPGKHKLATLSLRVKSGKPKLVIGSTSSLWGAARTSFGSQYEGKDGDNTIKFTDDPKNLGTQAEDTPGDWADAVGVGTAVGSAGMAMAAEGGRASFSVTIAQSPRKPSTTIRVQTTREGPLRIQVFDVAGRLVATLLDSASVPAGTHAAVLQRASLPSGLMLYRVEAAEGIRTGKLMILK